MLWMAACQFSRQEYWSGLLCPPTGDLPNPGIEPRFPALQADSLPSEPPEKPKNHYGPGSAKLSTGERLVSCVWLFVTAWTVAHQVPLSMEFSRQEYWSRLPFPSPEDLPDSGLEPRSPALQADYLLSDPLGKILQKLCHRTNQSLQVQNLSSGSKNVCRNQIRKVRCKHFQISNHVQILKENKNPINF